MVLPAGWQQIPGQNGFKTSDREVVLQVLNDDALVPPEQYLEATRMLYQLAFGEEFTKVSEEPIQVSGLAVKRIILTGKDSGGKDSLLWQIALLSKTQYWTLFVYAPREVLGSPNHPKYLEVQRVLTSFTLLEPVLARMKADLLLSIVETKEEVLAQAYAAWKKQDWPRAEELYGRLTKIDPYDADTWLRLGIAQAQQQKVAEAIVAFERSLALRDYFLTRYTLGMMLTTSGEVEKAVPHFQRAVELQPDYGPVWSALAQAQAQLGQFHEAQAAIREALKLEPTNRDYDQVAFAIEGRLAFEAHPKDAVDHANRGEQLALTGQNEEAAREYEAALRIAPDFADCHYNRGRILRRMGDFERAEREYRAAIAGYNADQRRLKADAQNNLADLLAERGVKTEEAVALVRAAISVRGERPSYLDTLAKACDAQGDKACAVGAYGRLLNSKEQLPPEVRRHAEERLWLLAPGQKP